MWFALLLLLLISSIGPELVTYRLSGPFHKCLPDESRCGVTPVYPGLLTTAFQYRCDSGVGLHFTGVTIAFAVITKGCQQASREHRSGSREGIEDGVVGVIFAQRGDFCIELLDDVEPEDSVEEQA